MGSLFRSEEMTLCQLFLQSEAAYACVSELGELGLVQFRDLNPDVNAFQRKFVNEVRRCDEMERKLRFLEKEIRKDGIPMLDTGDNPDAPAPREMIDLEATFEKLENEMKEVNSNAEALKRNFLELTELKHILRKTQAFFEEAELRHTQALHDPSLIDENVGLLGEEGLLAGGQAMRLGITPWEMIVLMCNITLKVVKRMHRKIHTEHGEGDDPIHMLIDAERPESHPGVSFVAGVILRERIPAFERMLWRACRGNVFLKQAETDMPLEDPVTGDQVNKSVFIIFFQGDQLKSRVKKICEGFRATLYPCPETPAERREMALGVMTRIEDLNTVLGQTQDHRHRVLVAAAKNIKVWFIKVRKIKAIYHTLNMFNLDVTQKCLIAECWCPVADLDRIQQALRRGTERSGSSVPSILNRMVTREKPPTYHRTNKFTQVFQTIVDSYGVASYREVNPAPFTIITFPFLFGVMFGDAGHGLIMALFAAWMVLKEKQLLAKKIDDEIWNTFFGGRYIILLMGFFSIYAGFIYNDAFAKSLNIFGSSWSPHFSEGDFKRFELLMMDPKNGTFSNSPYAFGLDPVWQLAYNKITFTNSLKMKLSVILGVSQMFFGISLSFWNHRYFQRKIDIFCKFIPELIFLFCMFGYLIILIFYKWVNFDVTRAHKAPSLLIGLINMFMFKKQEYPVFNGQEAVNILLVLLAVACVPWILASKPLVIYYQQRKKQKNQGSLPFTNGPSRTEDTAEVTHFDAATPKAAPEPAEEHMHPSLSIQSGDLLNHDRSQAIRLDLEVGENSVMPIDTEKDQTEITEEVNWGELIIHQAIHTIEFCLGCISHTASYLRLWALSLAHAQLSEVLWSMVMKIGLNAEGYTGAVLLVPVFAFWACLTIAVLLLMEGLSAFLHALRLHWVEFQSKFYEGQGYKFLPFSFELILDSHVQVED